MVYIIHVNYMGSHMVYIIHVNHMGSHIGRTLLLPSLCYRLA